MATKTAEKNKKGAPAQPPPPSDLDILAEEYLAFRIHQALVGLGEPAKIADIARAVGDEAVSIGLIRNTMTRLPHRFVSIDRRWDIATRYLDTQRPALRILEEIVAAYNAPICAWDAAHEYALVQGRMAEGVLAIVERVLRSSGAFAELTVSGNSRYVASSWLLDTNDDYRNDEAVLFYNFLKPDAAKPYAKVVLDWESDPAGSVEKLLKVKSGAGPRIIENRLVQFLAWKKLGEDFDARSLYARLLESSDLIVLPGHRWTDPETVETLRTYYIERAQLLAELPEEEVEVEEALPLVVTDTELAEFERIIEDNGDRAVRAVALLQEVFETGPGDRSYSADVQTLFETLRSNPDRYDWVGYDRFRIAGNLPPYIGQVPESLRFPIIPQIETAEGDLLDQLLDDEGFERGLERDVLSALAQDVNDQEPSDATVWPDGANAEATGINIVLKSHHKEIGTLPMCQIPVGFFAVEPSIVEITLRDKSGTVYQVFADYNTQLLYGIGLFDLYEKIEAESGVILRLEKTNVPGEFKFIDSGETNPDVYIAQERLDQLQSYRAEIEAGPTVATHDIVKYILEHSNSAMSYLALLTEVNIVRRVTRRQLASILSGWSGFAHRSGYWSYDSKKALQGFNKAKRKYLIS